MFEFNVGDLVEARKGELVIRDRVVMKTYGLALGAMDWSLSGARLNGHTLSLVEAATPPLPTEPGHYQDSSGRHWLHQIYDGGSYGCPAFDVDQWLDSEGLIEKFPEESAPFTKLEPVPVTAKKVLERVAEILRGTTLPNEFGNLAEEFGVTS